MGTVPAPMGKKVSPIGRRHLYRLQIVANLPLKLKYILRKLQDKKKKVVGRNGGKARVDHPGFFISKAVILFMFFI
jgi:hypothetical protein